jgi:hypothetical protein
MAATIEVTSPTGLKRLFKEVSARASPRFLEQAARDACADGLPCCFVRCRK